MGRTSAPRRRVVVLLTATRRWSRRGREVLQRQLQHTWDHLEKGKAEYQAGNGQGGQVMTAGYAMWALEVGAWQADETTTAVSHYLVEYQKDQHRWLTSSQRLPSMGSPFTATYVALRALSHYGTSAQADRIKARRDAAAKWVVENEAHDTEDRVFRLRTLLYFDAAEGAIQKDVVGVEPIVRQSFQMCQIVEELFPAVHVASLDQLLHEGDVRFTTVKTPTATQHQCLIDTILCPLDDSTSPFSLAHLSRTMQTAPLVHASFKGAIRSLL